MDHGKLDTDPGDRWVAETVAAFTKWNERSKFC
jgi:hypothetical protein